jgi:putative glutamine amidotransferase
LNPPLVAVPARASEPGVDPPPNSFLVSQAYVTALVAAGATPFIVPHLFSEALLRPLYDRADGLLLAGGQDVDPSRYGAERHPALGYTEDGRDFIELTLARWALAEGKPVLGVCRGMQLLNVAAGGTLVQDIGACCTTTINHDLGPAAPRDHHAHDVRIAPGSRLAQSVGAASLSVNSLHHQAVETLGAGLAASAWAPDGIVEGIEGVAQTAFALGVQWHPESLARDAASDRLFASFAHACALYRDRRITLTDQARGQVA